MKEYAPSIFALFLFLLTGCRPGATYAQKSDEYPSGPADHAGTSAGRLQILMTRCGAPENELAKLQSHLKEDSRVKSRQLDRTYWIFPWRFNNEYDTAMARVLENPEGVKGLDVPTTSDCEVMISMMKERM